MSFKLWLAFAFTTTLLAFSPGPGAAAAASAGVSRGFAAAFRLVLGLQAALLLQLTIIALGLGALLVASETAFTAVRLAGAAYLIWLGIAKLLEKPRPPEAGRPPAKGSDFLQGLLVNLANPKAIIFIGALVPQFIVPGRPHLPQYLTIAATMCGIDIAVMSGYGLLGVRLAVLLADPRRLAWANRFFGTAFLGLGVALLASSRQA